MKDVNSSEECWEDSLASKLMSDGKALVAKQDYVDTLNGKGNALGDLDKYKDASICYDHVLEMEPDNVDASFGKVIISKLMAWS